VAQRRTPLPRDPYYYMRHRETAARGAPSASESYHPESAEVFIEISTGEKFFGPLVVAEEVHLERAFGLAVSAVPEQGVKCSLRTAAGRWRSNRSRRSHFQ